MAETIALFGATGDSGNEVLAAALERGYKVRVMVRSPGKLTIKEHPNLTILEGDGANITSIQETVKGADYVISCVGGPLGKPKEFPVGQIVAFVKEMVKAMKETPSVKVFLHQSGAWCRHPDGTMPFSMKMMANVVGSLVGIGPNLKENEDITDYIDSIQGDIKFKTIATRPGALQKSAGGTKLVARESPPLGMASFNDLGAFTVNALKDEALYGTYPYVGPEPGGCCIA